EDGIRDFHVTGVQTCALPIYKLSSYRHVSPCKHFGKYNEGPCRQLPHPPKLDSKAMSLLRELLPQHQGPPDVPLRLWRVYGLKRPLQRLGCAYALAGLPFLYCISV